MKNCLCAILAILFVAIVGCSNQPELNLELKEELDKIYKVVSLEEVENMAR